MDLERHLRRLKRRCKLFFNSRLMDLERHFPSPKGCFGSFFNSLLGEQACPCRRNPHQEKHPAPGRRVAIFR
jgi:hypothetical protein